MSQPDPQADHPFVPVDLRIEYARGRLDIADVAADPVSQFQRWFDEAIAAKVPEANAMTLATADASGAPSARIVLLKVLIRGGFAFFTNYGSRKGRELEANPKAALCIYWQPLERQVRIEGRVERTTRAESEQYFHSRPLSAQVGAWVSRQSEVIEGREGLERRDVELLAEFGTRAVPLPDYWGGYRVEPERVEFWQGRPSRLHDRIRYSRDGDGWKIARLSP